jgi:hypothetical protein
MNNNKLIEYKDNIFIRIFKFFRTLFSRKKVYATDSTEESVTYNKNKSNFFENIQFQENEDEIQLKKLQLLYDNGEIDEDDLSEEEIDKLIKLYEKETEELNQDTIQRKIHIQNMLKELKYNN